MTSDGDAGALAVDYAPVREALAARDATAFVHAGSSDDPVLRYLARASDVDGELAVCVTPEQSMLFAPDDPDAARESFPGDRVLPGGGDVPTGERVAVALDDLGRSGTVLAPRTVPHDAALYLEDRGFEVASTAVVDDARVAKTDRERLRQRSVQAAADAAVARARTVLRESEREHGDGHGHGHGGDGAAVEGGESDHDPQDDHLAFEGMAVTTERLRREVAAELAAGGVDPGVVAVGAGADATPGSDAAIRPGEPVVLAIAPRDRDGYHGRVVRTLIVEGDGGWTRRAQLAADGAVDAALAELEPGATVAAVEREGVAELTAYGFDAPESVFDAHGVGLDRREPPLAEDAEIPEGAVLALDATASGPDGVVRVADLAVVTVDGAERLGTADRSLEP
ncbi:M24 family metallopeptidase [Halorubellus sp. JP-L1]|uniref:M24 family metallopeptidase n=1 Tax=Halorubellus sp. JP-L1 TaxID=2715753 RepID=UPI001408BC50|nr:M24 family metallopeptidase [Halorubellus sp. JP-L1]NHN42004.1 M24 family metallopeptidase [Halorubellus sp. JP-L1]